MPRIFSAIILALLTTEANAEWPSQQQMDRIRNWHPHVGDIQKPGETQTPGEIQKPGEIQAPKTIEVKKAPTNQCETHIGVLADALFDFDKADLRQDAEETLKAAIPQIEQVTEQGKHPARVDGHTDGKGGDEYNMRLSEARARTVRDWLARQQVLPATAEIVGYGKTMPVAPNTFDDGRDNPEGRQKNRRVEITVETCKG